jgi:beta-lactamase superfamily II metal-dependent hydrolase
MLKDEQLKLSFKNVGQGDCIIVEWRNNENEIELGLIDCNSCCQNSKAVMADIKACITTQSKKIRFLVLSHPHHDHFSGLNEILDYCEQENITIQHIYHTSLFNKEYLNQILSPVNTPTNDVILGTYVNPNEKIALGLLFNKFIALQKKGTKLESISANKRLTARNSTGLQIECIAPTSKSLEHYIKKTFSKGVDTTIRGMNNPDANLLSTILLLSTSKWQVILTSDAYKDTFAQILEEDTLTLNDDRPVYVLQVPHHGSQTNHYPIFWSKSYVNKTLTNTVISVGNKNKYRHPSNDVVTFFETHTKDVFITNQAVVCQSSRVSNIDKELYDIDSERNQSIGGGSIVATIKNDTCNMMIIPHA